MTSKSVKPVTARVARFTLGRLPTRSTLAKMWNARKSTRGQGHGEHDVETSTQWVEGDLLWAKLSGYPIWPCMVARDPFTNQFAKIHDMPAAGARTIAPAAASLSYHVQFFGVGGERSWVKEESLMEFKGRQAFIDEARQAPYKYKISGAWIQKLNFAIAQADKALPYSRHTRKQRFGLKYVFGANERSLRRVLDCHFRYSVA